MFSFFKKRKTKNAVLEPVFTKVNNWVNACQHNLADKLQAKTNNCSIGKLKTLLLLFVLFFGAACAFVVFDSLTGKKNYTKPAKILMPKHITGNEANTTVDSLAPEVQRIRRFSAQMQALKQTPEGKHFYDSLVAARPGLMDSIALVEKIIDHK